MRYSQSLHEDTVCEYLNWGELTDAPMDEAAIVALLGQISAYDALQVLGRLSCMLHGARMGDPDRQILIMRRMGGAQGPLEEVCQALQSGKQPLLFFPQQVIHLTRLAILHCDPRPADDFNQGEKIFTFLMCLFGVTNIFKDNDLDSKDSRLLVSAVLRQSSINHRQNSLLLWSRFFDVFIRTWNEVATPEAFDAAAAFRRYTGMELQDWLTVGFSLYSHFRAYGDGSSEEFYLFPDAWFANSTLGQNVHQVFVQANSLTLEQYRRALATEERRYGSTLHRCQTLEERPLLDRGDGRIIPLSLDSLERRATEGIFFELVAGSQREGYSREHFTSPFGRVLEEFVQRTLERAIPPVGAPRVYRPHHYKRGGNKVEASDAVVDCGQVVVFGEIVVKRPTVATITRGDYHSFERDLEDAVLKKARQLHLNIEAYRNGDLVYSHLTFKEDQKLWPVLFVTEGFPIMPPIPAVIEEQLLKRGWLIGLPPLAIFDSDDLATLEGLLAAGFSLAELLEIWKGDAQMADLPFTNFIISRGDAGDERIRSFQLPDFYQATFKELTDQIIANFRPTA